jgi:hypothetical protein
MRPNMAVRSAGSDTGVLTAIRSDFTHVEFSFSALHPLQGPRDAARHVA